MPCDYLIFPLVEERLEASVLAIGKGSQTLSSRSPIKYRESAVIHYILSGFGFFDGIKVSAGQGFFFNPGEIHNYYGLEEGSWEYIFIEIDADLAKRIVVPVIHADEHGIFTYSFKEWLKKWEETRIGNEKLSFVSETEAVYLATSILRHHTAETYAPNEKQPLYVQKAQAFIERNLHVPLTVTEVAKAVHLNPRYLCKLFVQYAGTGIKEYITDQKIQLAGELLAKTKLSVKEVSFAIGIKDPNSFSKLFRLQTGTSPSVYREHHSEKLQTD